MSQTTQKYVMVCRRCSKHTKMQGVRFKFSDNGKTFRTRFYWLTACAICGFRGLYWVDYDYDKAGCEADGPYKEIEEGLLVAIGEDEI